MSADAPRRRSPLELLLPGGCASSALVLGSACPERLRPAAAAPGEGPVDLVVVAPAAAESGRVWLTHAIDECVDRLEPDGVAYLLLDRRDRTSARRLLRERSLFLESPLLHLPDVAATRQLVPLAPRPARYAFKSVVPLVPWKRIAAEIGLRAGAGAALAAAAPDVALVARRPGARPLFEWLGLPGGGGAGRPTAVVSSSARPGATGVVVHPFEHAGPAVVAKLALDPAALPSHEAERLVTLGPAARQAGAAVPEPLRSFDLHGLRVLVESRIEGDIAAPRLIRRPAGLERVAEDVVGWLERWHAATARRASLTAERLERELLTPAEVVAPLVTRGADYLAALRERCERLEGVTVPLAASHNDLTMWNVLVARDGALGVVDWEAAEEATLPLKDFFYAVADAVAATRRYADRPAAVADCFAPGGERAGFVARLRARIASSVELDPDVADACFHACWLGHAANEARSARPSDARPFREIVERLAAATLAGR